MTNAWLSRQGGLTSPHLLGLGPRTLRVKATCKTQPGTTHAHWMRIRMRGSEGGANAHRLGYAALDGSLSILWSHSRIANPGRLRWDYTIHSWRARLCPTRGCTLRLGKHVALTAVGS